MVRNQSVCQQLHQFLLVVQEGIWYRISLLFLLMTLINLRGIPNYDYKKGKLTFPKAASISKVEEQGESAEVSWLCVKCAWCFLFIVLFVCVQCSTFEPFCGQGATIRQKKKH